MDKLELKHISPYLPYGLKMHCPSSNVLIHDYLPMDFIQSTIDLNLSFGWKPILRPMSSLTQEELKRLISHIFRDTRMIRPKMESIKFEKGFITFYDLYTSMTYVAVKPGHEGYPVMNMSNTIEDYDIFFELHIDMRKLIDKGLAIDINTLGQEGENG